MNQTRHHVPPARGFTLLEIMVVVLILAIVSATAVPAFSFYTQGRRAAAGVEVQRLLEQCRSLSMAEGTPMGLSIDLSAQRIRRQVILTPGSAPTAPQTSDGRTDEGFTMEERFPGILIESVTDGQGSTSTFSSITGTGTVVIWFSFDGTPQSRDEAGTLLSPWTADASIQIRDGQTLRVSRVTGVISR